MRVGVLELALSREVGRDEVRRARVGEAEMALLFSSVLAEFAIIRMSSLPSLHYAYGRRIAGYTFRLPLAPV